MPGSERIRELWQAATPRTRMTIAGAAAVVAALVIGGAAFGAMAMGGDGGGDSTVLAPTEVPPTATPETPTPSLFEIATFFAAIAPTATPTPEFRGGGGGGGGGGGSRPASRGTGPGPILTSDIRLQIPKLGINTAVHSRTVGTNGVMGDPSGPWMVLWYDFRPFSGGVGGYPGEAGANVVFAGHVDYINVGPAVFYGIKNLGPGDQIIVSGANGPVTYAVQWAQTVNPNVDFTGYVAKQGQETVTLVTCIGAFSAGHYTSRLVVRAVRV